MLLKIKNLKLKTIIGVHDWEQTINREIIINLEIAGDFTKSLTSDNIDDAIDYDKISSQVKEVALLKRFKLIETMAQEILNKIIEDQRISKCKIEVDKIGAIDFVDSASITLEFSKENGS